MSTITRIMVALVAITLISTAAQATVINDGSTVDNLTAVMPGNSTATATTDGSVVTMTVNVVAPEQGRAALLHDSSVGMTEYTVSGEWTEGTGDFYYNHLGGVIGWFDASTSKGISLMRWRSDEIALAGWDGTSQWSSSMHADWLYDSSGTQLTSPYIDITSSNANLGGTATYSLQFVALTASEQSAYPTFTTKLIASADDGDNTWSETFYTDLAAPTTGNHRVGYMGEYYGVHGSGLNVGTYDNLTLVPEPATMGLLAMGGLAILRRRRR